VRSRGEILQVANKKSSRRMLARKMAMFTNLAVTSASPSAKTQIPTRSIVGRNS
jgi:hypothetical protein